MKSVTSTDLKLLSHRQQVQFAIFCAKQVEAKWKQYPACVAAVATAEAWLEGKATAEECRKAASAAAYASNASNAAYAAANAAYAASNAANAAYAAADAAYAAADAAAYAVYAAAKEATITEQWKYFYALLGELGKVLYF